MLVRISYGKVVRNIVGSMWICILCASCRWGIIFIRVQLLYSSVILYLFNFHSVASCCCRCVVISYQFISYSFVVQFLLLSLSLSDLFLLFSFVIQFYFFVIVSLLLSALFFLVSTVVTVKY